MSTPSQVEPVQTGWQETFLGEVVNRVDTSGPDSTLDSFTYVDLSSVDAVCKRIAAPREVSTAEAPSRARQRVSAQDVLVSTVRPNLNGVAMVPDDLDGSIASTGFCVLRSKRDELDPRYLFHWVRSDFFVSAMVRRTTGASYPAVSDSIVKGSSIPLPPHPEQRRIADILDRADDLRAKRRRVLAYLDELEGSVFSSMFGDVTRNVHGFAVIPFADLGRLDRGVSRARPRNSPRLLGGNHPLVQTGEVAGSEGYIRTFTQTYSDEGLAQSRMWPAGTLAITIAANIAKTGVLTFSACFPDSVVGFTPEPSKTNVEYIRFWLRSLQATLERQAPASAQKNINLSILRELQVPVPPVVVQDQFASNIASIQLLKAEQRGHLTKLDELFASLQHRAFSGEL